MQAALSSLDRKNDLRLDSLETKIDNINQLINKKITSQVGSMKEEVIKQVSESVIDNLKQEVRNEVREIDDQKSRVMNVIVFNLQESELENSENRINIDKMNFTQICNSIGVENFDIKLAFRLGNRKEGINRPLKVILDSKKTRIDIINNAKFIVNKAPERFKRVVIVKDLTPSQREFNRKRREEYRNKKKQLDIHLHESTVAHTSKTEVNNSMEVETTLSNTIQRQDSQLQSTVYNQSTLVGETDETIRGGLTQESLARDRGDDLPLSRV